ncbi:MAG: M3 family metallopeptidase, partial [Gammaproteobacteria bacterium]|nr:M3 family metallopeptidase [Gammaproteobacteria bacterium]NNJ84698.1 M3 family metallopeptidase [Gammaproteobacteria bacterium]
MSDPTYNPLLNPDVLPAFSQINPKHVVPAVEQSLKEARATVADLGADTTQDLRWDDLIPPLEALNDRLERIWSPVSHLHSVADNPALREAYNLCLPMLSEYSTEFGQNEQLFHACRHIAQSDEMAGLPPEKRKILENTLLDFRLSGVGLGTNDKARFKALSTRLSTLESKFSENVLDATGAWKKHITQRDALSGLPDTTLALARETAEREGQDGWMLTLEFPAYISVITFADDRALRREIYEAYTTRASDQGPHAGQWDNTEVMEEILALRDEKSRLLGFANYLEYSLVRKMAPSANEVFAFLRDLARRARPVAEQDLRDVRAFARETDGIEVIEAWDILYYSERLRQHTFAFSQEELRPYFPAPRVLAGLFQIVGRLFGLHIESVENEERWHPDVGFYEIRDDNGKLRGRFFLDLYARPHKRGGAWMGECITRSAFGEACDDNIQLPVAHLVCNFSPPLAGKPSLLTHEEVLTLFHEFGHGLHHLLTKVDYPSIAGINGVAWDAVELPSQLLELWCWEHEALQQFSGHVETGEPLPDTLLEKLRTARNFQSGMAMVRQLEFSLFDLRIHREYDRTQGSRIQQFLDEVRDEVAVLKPPAFHRFAHAFSHIFAGGYAAGYYSYKWAEVLASDAFSKFEENGIFDQDTGDLFQRTVLAHGGARDAMDLFVAFRGRKPTIDALLRH